MTVLNVSREDCSYSFFISTGTNQSYLALVSIFPSRQKDYTQADTAYMLRLK
jgi:hypothetical protein